MLEQLLPAVSGIGSSTPNKYGVSAGTPAKISGPCHAAATALGAWGGALECELGLCRFAGHRP